MLQGGEKVVGSLKDIEEDKGKVLGKVISTHIPTSIPMKSIVTSSTITTVTPNVELDLSMLQ